MPSRRILIVGGSTRAAADSVRRAGWQPICADLFADFDLRQTAKVIPVENYPQSLPQDVANVEADGWFYCGALENHPRLLEKMLVPNAPYGPLLGTSPEALRSVRNPHWLHEILRSARVHALDVTGESLPPSADGSWLQKPLASAGGRAIRIWDQAASQVPFGEPHYFQRRVSGVGLSAVFRVENNQIEWMGAAHELENSSTSQPPTPFSYCGSYGPLKRTSYVEQRFQKSKKSFRFGCRSDHRNSVAGPVRIQGCAVFQTVVQRQLNTIAKMLVKRLDGLRGLVGLDFRLVDDKVWLTEVNPRYTASVEILELASGRSMLNRDALGHSKHRVIAKQILYATTLLRVPDLSRYLDPLLTLHDPWHLPLMTDIPIPGSTIEPGWPICTVLAGGPDAKAVETSLRQRVSQVQEELAR